MSRFIAKLKQVTKSDTRQMGFRAEAISARPRPLLVAGLTRLDGDWKDEVAGADAGLLHVTASAAKSLPKAMRLVPDIPWGVWLEGGEVGPMVEAGSDFVVFPAADTPLAVPGGEGVGRVLLVEPSLSDGLLRTINQLPVDAVLVAGGPEAGSLSWYHLMLFWRFAAVLSKPLLASVPAGVTADGLQALWGAGVDGVIAPAGGAAPGAFKGLRQLIDQLVFPSSRRRGKIEALLPHVAGEPEVAIGEEEEEEEEE
jgi:hypothetical protein